MKLLAIGDVVAKPGLLALSSLLRPARRRFEADFVIVNGENANAVGITPAQAEEIFQAGADVITLGNHTFHKPEIADYLDENAYILRPANFTHAAPGRGYAIYEVGRKRLLLIDLIGRLSMPFDASDNPFLKADRILKENAGEYDVAVCEIHAEATSEKEALGFYLDGRAALVYGTHTHVPTADARINPQGTGYITDIGKTGPLFSVLGIRPEQSVAFFCGGIPGRYQVAEGPCQMNGVFADIDDDTSRCRAIEQFTME